MYKVYNLKALSHRSGILTALKTVADRRGAHCAVVSNAVEML